MYSDEDDSDHSYEFDYKPYTSEGRQSKKVTTEQYQYENDNYVIMIAEYQVVQKLLKLKQPIYNLDFEVIPYQDADHEHTPPVRYFHRRNEYCNRCRLHGHIPRFCLNYYQTFCPYCLNLEHKSCTVPTSSKGNLFDDQDRSQLRCARCLDFDCLKCNIKSE